MERNPQILCRAFLAVKLKMTMRRYEANIVGLPSLLSEFSLTCLVETPKNPIVLAHGLLGFNEFRLAGKIFPAIHYWRGITEALTANGVEVITASVPASASIEDRAAKLSTEIEKKAGGKSVNIIAWVKSHMLSYTSVSYFE